MYIYCFGNEVIIAKKKFSVDFHILMINWYDKKFDQLKHTFEPIMHKEQMP